MERRYYPRSMKDLSLPPYIYRKICVKSCVICGKTADWASPLAPTSPVCMGCADAWRGYVRDYKLHKWYKHRGWKVEYKKQFRRFLQYYRSCMREWADAGVTAR